MLKIVLIEWTVVNGCALVVWLFALRCAGLKRRLRVLPVLKLFHELDLTLMERIGFVVALSVTALAICWFVTLIVLLLILCSHHLSPEGVAAIKAGSLASLLAHLVGYVFHRIARKRTPKNEDGIIHRLGEDVFFRSCTSVIVTILCIVFAHLAIVI